jgi:hypothetical protein
VSRALALAIVFALAACGKGDALPPAHAPAHAGALEPALDATGRRVHVQRLFSLALPRGWERVRHDDAGGPERRPGENLVRFEDGRGRFLVVAFDAMGAGFTADASWTLVLLPTGDAVAVAAEEPPCRPPAYGSSSEAMDAELDECPAGDGRLTLAATAEIRAHRYTFFFGDERHERGVDLAVFRDALASFRAR